MNANRRFLTSSFLSFIPSIIIIVSIMIPQYTLSNITLLMTPEQLDEIEQQAQSWCAQFAPQLTPRELQNIATELYFLQGAAILDARIHGQMNALMKSIEIFYTTLQKYSNLKNDITDDAQAFINDATTFQKTLIMYQTINQSLDIASNINDTHERQCSKTITPEQFDTMTTTTPVDTMTATTPVDTMTATTPVDTMTATTPVDTIAATIPVETMATTMLQEQAQLSFHNQFEIVSFAYALNSLRTQGADILKKYALQHLPELNTKLDQANQTMTTAHETLNRYIQIYNDYIHSMSSHTTIIAPPTSHNTNAQINAYSEFQNFNDNNDIPFKLYVGVEEEIRANSWSLLASAANFTDQILILETLASIIYKIYYTTIYTYMQQHQLDDYLYITFAPDMPLANPSNFTYDLANLISVNRAIHLAK